MERPGPELARRFAIAMFAELVYIAGRTAIIQKIGDGIPHELAWNAWRAPFILLYAWLAAPFLFPAEVRRPMPRHPLLALAILLLLTDIGVEPARGPPLYRGVLAITAFLPAIREELFYRVILQGCLERHVGPVASILLAAILFTAYHYGVQDLGLLNASSIFAAGAILGAIYQRTRSLAVVAGLHTVIDVLYAVCPWAGFPPGLGLLCAASAAVWGFGWWRLDVDRNGINWR